MVSPPAIQDTRNKIKALGEDLVSLADSFDPSATGSWGLESDVVTKAKAVITAAQSPSEHAVGMSVSGMEVAVLRTLIFLNVFDCIPATGSIALIELSNATSTDPAFLARLLRPCIGSGLVRSETHDTYAHTPTSLGYRSAEMSATLFTCCFDEGIDVLSRLPEYLALKRLPPSSTHPQGFFPEPGSGADGQTHNPWNWRMGAEGRPNYEVLAQHPARMQRMHTLLGSIAHLNPFTGFYDFSKLAVPPLTDSPARTVFVDIGGGHGFAIAHMLAAHPAIRPEQCVLQDLESVVREAAVAGPTADPPLPAAVRTLAHDYFAPQPVRGARAYHLRAVAHNLNDANLLRVLAAVTLAMARDSRLLIADNIIPDLGVRGLSGFMDLMMLPIGGKERTESEFREVLARAGLRVDGIYKADGGRNYAMIEASLI